PNKEQAALKKETTTLPPTSCQTSCRSSCRRPCCVSAAAFRAPSPPCRSPRPPTTPPPSSPPCRPCNRETTPAGRAGPRRRRRARSSPYLSSRSTPPFSVAGTPR
ncbi:unnamed protein product, partial [Ectocarpus fasciculatus]